MTKLISGCYKLSSRDRLGTLEYSTRQFQNLDGPIQTVVAVPPDLESAVASLDGVDAWITVDEDSLTYARNRLADRATGDIVAFMDSDAWPRPGYAECLRDAIPNRAHAAGGPLVPRADPGWLPDEFQWLIGCGPYYDAARMVPNTYGSNFAVDADAFAAVGGFDESIGMGSGGVQQGGETKLARELRRGGYDAVWYDPDAVVVHDVGPADARLRNVLPRAYHQGRAKAAINIQGRESAFLREELPAALCRGPRSALASLGLTAVVASGYLRERCGP